MPKLMFNPYTGASLVEGALVVAVLTEKPKRKATKLGGPLETTGVSLFDPFLDGFN